MPLLLEHWKPIVGWEELYEISNLGSVRRLKRSKGARAGRMIRPYLNGEGYLAVNLWKNAEQHKYSVHALVATVFIGPYPDGQEVNHKDSNRRNPRASNLEYLTRSENIIHGRDRLQRLEGRRSRTASLSLEQVLDIYSLRGRLSCSEIAEQFRVSRQLISSIMFGREWAWATVATGDYRPPRTGDQARDRLRDQILAADPSLSSRAVGKLLGTSHTTVIEVWRKARLAASSGTKP